MLLKLQIWVYEKKKCLHKNWKYFKLIDVT